LDFENITIYRGERKALDRVSFRVEQGEHAAILGPNGCGKSTLIRTIHRDFYPSLADGDFRLEILGQQRWNVWELRRMIGVVSNDVTDACRRDVTGREVVLSGFFSSIGIQSYHQATDEQRAKAEAVIQELDLTPLADRWLDELSSGEARRFVVGRALVNEPAALLFDEPSNSLDFRAQAKLRETMSAMARAGRTLLLVTHELSDVVPEMERVILMKGGRVFADGAKAQVLTSRCLSELFELRLEVVERNGRYVLV
jgi:iron complex transport system ATP-binding protein